MKPFDDLLHRVNNLLGTIEVQIEVARAEASLAAYEKAMAYIAESARRTREEARVLAAQVRSAEGQE